MKYLLTLIVLMAGCATSNKDPLQDNLAKYVTRCGCMLQDVNTTPIHEVNWQDKQGLKKQFKSCQCTVEFGFDDVSDPLTYLKPGTTFYQKQKGFPWDEDFKRIEQVKE